MLDARATNYAMAPSEAHYWDAVARTLVGQQKWDSLLAEQYARVHLELIRKWSGLDGNNRILKTDLFAEALCPGRSFLWDLLGSGATVVGIDISEWIASRAAQAAHHYARRRLDAVVSDVRDLPFADCSFDLVVSDSTLDHFADKADIMVALAQLARVLSAGGTLVITMDNKGNLTHPFFRLWIDLSLAPFYIGQTLTMGQLKEALTTVGLSVVDTGAIIHNPRLFTRIAVALLRRKPRESRDRGIRDMLTRLDDLAKLKTRFLTAQFIAAKAVKTRH